MRRYALVIMIGVLIVLLALLLIPTGGTETAHSEPSVTEAEIIIEEHNGLRIKGVFRGEKTEPKNRERGERYEQETGEEVVTEAPTESGAVCDAAYCEPIPTTTAPETTWLAPSSEEIPHPAPVETTPQDKLLTALRNAGIEWWWPYAYAQVTQESHWDPNAVNANGLDFGLLQYRITYYPGANIFDPYEQIRIYVGQVKARIDAGLSVEEIISRHLTSDYVTEVNWTYVNDVLRWMQ